MNKKEFNQLTKNWKLSQTSLNIVYDLFVNNNNSNDVANKYKKTLGYVNIYKQRFIDRLQKKEIEKSYTKLIYELWDKALNINEIKKYLKNEKNFIISKDDLIDIITKKGLKK